jgi:hypothetical protein
MIAYAHALTPRRLRIPGHPRLRPIHRRRPLRLLRRAPSPHAMRDQARHHRIRPQLQARRGNASLPLHHRNPGRNRLLATRRANTMASRRPTPRRANPLHPNRHLPHQQAPPRSLPRQRLRTSRTNPAALGNVARSTQHLEPRVVPTISICWELGPLAYQTQRIERQLTASLRSLA